MHYREASPAIARLLDSSAKVLAVSHANPDADAIASLLAFRNVFENDQRSVTMTIGPGTIPATLEFLPGIDAVRQFCEVIPAEYDLLVLLDCADEERVGESGAEKIASARGSVPVINIDHHVTNRRFGDENLIDPEAAATCEILSLLFRDLDATFDSTLATILLSGIQGDTLGLRTPSTTGQTLEVSAHLLRSGADLDTIVDFLFRVRPFSTVKLWGLALGTASLHGSLVWTAVTPEMLESSNADESEGEGIVNFLAGTMGARAAALLYQKPDGWRVSMRSLADDVDVAVLAGLFGGGGHSRAAGCRLAPGIESRDAFLNTIAEQISRDPAHAAT